MQQKQKIDVQLLAYVEPKPEERTWCPFECVPFGESWKHVFYLDLPGNHIPGCYQKKKLNPSMREDVDF